MHLSVCLRGGRQPHFRPRNRTAPLSWGPPRAPAGNVRIMRAGAKTPTPATDLQIHVRRNSFQSKRSPGRKGTTDRPGFLSAREQTQGSFTTRLRFLSCLSNNTVRWQEPVPIFGDEAYLCYVNINNDPMTRPGP